MGELQSDFCRNPTEFYQISRKNLPYLTGFSQQLLACMTCPFVDFAVFQFNYLCCLQEMEALKKENRELRKDMKKMIKQYQRMADRKKELGEDEGRIVTHECS